ncbi:MAG: hypothetical protein NUV57_02835 [archaeon]|nr:hypothetical protein [archaeon]
MPIKFFSTGRRTNPKKSSISKIIHEGDFYEDFVHFRGKIMDVLQATSEEVASGFREAGVTLDEPEKVTQQIKDVIKSRLLIFSHGKITNNPNPIEVQTNKGVVMIGLDFSPQGKLVRISAVPWVHTIRNKYVTPISSFSILKKILRQGFKSTRDLNFGDNVYAKMRSQSPGGFRYSSSDVTAERPSNLKGDAYTLEFVTPLEHRHSTMDNEYILRNANPESITRVQIHISKEISEKEAKRRMAFYSRELKGMAIKFFR